MEVFLNGSIKEIQYMIWQENQPTKYMAITGNGAFGAIKERKFMNNVLFGIPLFTLKFHKKVFFCGKFSCFAGKSRNYAQ
jgi:hypothetical protein